MKKGGQYHGNEYIRFLTLCISIIAFMLTVRLNARHAMERFRIWKKLAR
jgi:hypothetical protein